MGSVKTRKVSTQSLQSTASAEDSALSATIISLDDPAAAAAAAAAAAGGGGGGGGGEAACEDGQDAQADLRDAAGADEVDCCRNMPWIKVLALA